MSWLRFLVVANVRIALNQHFGFCIFRDKILKRRDDMHTKTYR
jgi:hypothetical protein